MDPRTEAPEESRAPREAVAPRVGYLPGLDGLRAVAVLAVLLYHGGVRGFAGGFLGVEVFFVISGYLITALLVAERRTAGRIDMKRFWIRRGRRLLPALITVLVVVSVYTALFLRDDLDQLRGDILGSLFYVMNWWTIFGETSYFAEFGAPPLLKHLWSLAIEEQFYLLWPFLFVGLWKLARGRADRAARIALSGAALSAAWMWWLYDPDAPDRVYMGTDTRASSLLLGAALAFVWAPWRLSKRTGPNAAAVLDAAGVIALLVLVAMFVGVNQASGWLYPFGFLVTSIATAVAIAVAVHPSSRTVRLGLGTAALVWVGKRSYGLYLWNWPVVAITDVQRGFPLTGAALTIFQLVATFGLAEASFRFIEAPIRSGSWRTALTTLRKRTSALDERRRRRFTIVTGGATVVAVLLAVFTVTSMLTAQSSEARLTEEVLGGRDSVLLRPSTPASNGSGVEATAPGDATVTTAPVVPAVSPIYAIGDSVMQGAAESLASWGDVTVDAAKNRQFCVGEEIINQLRAQHLLSPTIVVHLGTNGRIDPACLERTLANLADRDKVVFVNLRVPRPWQGANNELLAAEVAKYPNAVLVDWWTAGNNNDTIFYDDATHLRRPEGADFYAATIRHAIDTPLPPASTAPTTTVK